MSSSSRSILLKVFDVSVLYGVWTTVRLADFWEERIYDLKPQYKDTLTRYDSSVIEVPVWIKDPGWGKE